MNYGRILTIGRTLAKCKSIDVNGSGNCCLAYEFYLETVIK